MRQEQAKIRNEHEPAEEILLELTNLSLSYGDQNVVEHAGLSLKPGETLCIAGESGSGKSTLLKAIHGMDAVNVTGGDILYHGRPLPKLTARERRSLMGTGIGLIPQNPQGSFNPLRSFRAQMKETMQSHGRTYAEEEMIVLLASMGLPEGEKLLRCRPYELSGGMNQRVAIVFSLLLQPEILLCDEITSALDVTSGRKVLAEIKEYAARSRAAIIMVTHHLGIARRMSDHLAVMKDGRIVEYGETRKVLSDPQDAYTRMLLSSIPHMRGTACDLSE